MITVHEIADVRSWRDTLRPRRLALVPTMGNLHAGHMQLVRAAHAHAGVVAVSIFVNPLQFGPSEDFATYPRTPDEDLALLQRHGVDLVFAPAASAMYPQGNQPLTRVLVGPLGSQLCGKFRPGHFDGVATVVAKLFNIFEADIACFGEKDYQQLTIIRQMVRDLDMSVRIVGVPIARADDGLALSSRNRYLSPADRDRAPLLAEALRRAADGVRHGVSILDAETGAVASLVSAGFEPDYVEIRAKDTLLVPSADDKHLVLLAAARLGKTRLIDNLEFSR